MSADESSQPAALITGGGTGIGAATARRLAADGFHVVIAGRRRERLDETATAINVDLPGAASVLVMDVTSDVSVRDAVAGLGRCDVLVNNAAIDYDTDARASSADLDRVHTAFETNLFGAWRTVLAFLPLLRQSPHPRIVNVSSEGGSLAGMGGGTPSYHTSKAALNALTLTLAAELRRDRILVNAICPGWTATDMGEHGGRPVADGAASVMWGVQLPDDGPTGGFYRDGRIVPW